MHKVAIFLHSTNYSDTRCPEMAEFSLGKDRQQFCFIMSVLLINISQKDIAPYFINLSRYKISFRLRCGFSCSQLSDLHFQSRSNEREKSPGNEVILTTSLNNAFVVVFN